jgi:methionyl-tRNA formyltransferase
MKTLLATSQVTYVPRNYVDLFDELVSRVARHLTGVMFLRTLDGALIKTMAGLYALGCHRVAWSLTRNILELPLRRRERLAERHGLTVLHGESMNDAWIIEWIREQDIDLVVNLRTRCIYKPEVLAAPKIGCINIHHGLLPVYRGTMCDLFALSENRAAGFTIHVMNETIDAGQILLRREVSDGSEKNYARYLAKTGREEGKALAELISKIAETGVLPAGEPNQAEKIFVSRTPRSRQAIRELKARGMVL